MKLSACLIVKDEAANLPRCLASLQGFVDEIVVVDTGSTDDTVRIARDIAHQGNASAASVPLALRQMVLDGEARSGDLALLIAFGAGLAYAAQVVRLP